MHDCWAKILIGYIEYFLIITINVLVIFVVFWDGTMQTCFPWMLLTMSTSKLSNLLTLTKKITIVPF